MPRRDDLYTNNIQNRYATLEEAGKTALTPQQLSILQNSQRQFFDELGIVADENWEVSNDGVVPRFFVLAPDKEYHDSILPLASVNIKPGSPEFWKEVQLGNIFAYPLESEDPVQLQLTENKGKVSLSYSEPVTASNLPEPPVQPVRWYHRVAHFFTGGKAYDEMIKKFDNLEEDRANKMDKFGDMQGYRKYAFKGENERHQAKADEIKAAEEKAARELEEKRRKEAQALEEKRNAEALNYAGNAVTAHGNLKRGLEQATSVLQPVPKFDPSILKRPDAPDGEKKEGLYTKEQFANLEVYDKDQIDLSQIKLGKNGKPVTNEEFAAVAFFGLWDPKNAMVMYNKAEPDIHAEKALTDMGYNKEQAGVLLTGRMRNFWSSDLFLVPPRDNEGSNFKDVTNLGRRAALEAFQAYQNGDKTKLAGMIANGINLAGGDLATVDRPDVMTEQQKGAVIMASKVIDLMKKDPELQAEALKQGMDPEKLRAAKGMTELAKIMQDREDAEYKMSQAVKNGTELSEQEKKEYTTAMLKGRIVTQMLYADNKKNSGALDAKIEELGPKVVFVNKFDLEKWTKNPETRPELPEGKIYSDTYTKIVPSMATTEMALSESLRQLGDKGGLKQVEMVAQEIYQQNDLSKVSTKELFRNLNEHNTSTEFKTAENIVKATTELKNQAEKAKKADKEKDLDKNLENEIEKKPTIKDRAQMFEPKI